MTEANRVVPDPVARERALRRAAMPESLLIPIAAVDRDAIVRHIGSVCEPIPGVRMGNAFRVIAEGGPRPSDLSVWRHQNAHVISQTVQVWVAAKYTGYRKAYKTVFPHEDIRGRVVHHIMNRRYARLHGFEYVRVVPISNATNVSSGFSESWGVNLTRAGTLRSRIGEASISYADLAHMMSMLDMPAGGGVMDNVREAASLLYPA